MNSGLSYLITTVSEDYSYQIWSSIMIISQESNVIRRMGSFAPGELFQSFCWPHFEEKMSLPKFEKCCDICFLEILLLYKLFRLSIFVILSHNYFHCFLQRIFFQRFLKSKVKYLFWLLNQLSSRLLNYIRCRVKLGFMINA